MDTILLSDEQYKLPQRILVLVFILLVVITIIKPTRVDTLQNVICFRMVWRVVTSSLPSAKGAASTH